MSTRAAELLEIMTLRLKMLESGVTNPSPSVKAVTKLLVEKLGSMNGDEEIEISVVDKQTGRYIRASTREVLAEIYFHEKT